MIRLLRVARDAFDVLRHSAPSGLVRALRPGPRLVLNARGGAQRSAVEAAEGLGLLGRRLKAEAIDEHGRVHYGRLRGSALHTELRETAGALVHAAPDALCDDAARIAFWINVYNVLAIDGVVELGLERSVMERPDFFSTVAYRVGDYDFALDEVEHGVLRRNAPSPVTGRPVFDTDDPRLSWRPDALDARIHFALVCASTSCPPTAFYSAERLDEQLRLATESFIEAGVELRRERRELLVPLLFDWYVPDFGGHERLARWLEDHAPEPLAGELRDAQGYALRYRRYDWSLNAVG